MHTTRRVAVAALAVVAPLVLFAAPADAGPNAARRGCTTALVYEHNGVDFSGPFTDRVYRRDCPPRPCTLYYTTTAAGTHLVWTDCTTGPRKRQIG